MSASDLSVQGGLRPIVILLLSTPPIDPRETFKENCTCRRAGNTDKKKNRKTIPTTLNQNGDERSFEYVGVLRDMGGWTPNWLCKTRSDHKRAYVRFYACFPIS